MWNLVIGGGCRRRISGVGGPFNSHPVIRRADGIESLLQHHVGMGRET